MCCLSDHALGPIHSSLHYPGQAIPLGLGQQSKQGHISPELPLPGPFQISVPSL